MSYISKHRILSAILIWLSYEGNGLRDDELIVDEALMEIYSSSIASFFEPSDIKRFVESALLRKRMDE